MPMTIDTHKTLDASDVLRVYGGDGTHHVECSDDVYVREMTFLSNHVVRNLRTRPERDAWAYVHPRWARIHHLLSFACFWVAGTRARLYWAKRWFTNSKEGGDEPAIMLNIESIAMVLNVMGIHSLSAHVCIKSVLLREVRHTNVRERGDKQRGKEP